MIPLSGLSPPWEQGRMEGRPGGLAAVFVKKSPEQGCPCSGGVEVPPRFELGVELLQSSALPLGYGTIHFKVCS